MRSGFSFGQAKRPERVQVRLQEMQKDSHTDEDFREHGVVDGKMKKKTEAALSAVVGIFKLYPMLSDIEAENWQCLEWKNETYIKTLTFCKVPDICTEKIDVGNGYYKTVDAQCKNQNYTYFEAIVFSDGDFVCINMDYVKGELVYKDETRTEQACIREGLKCHYETISNCHAEIVGNYNNICTKTVCEQERAA